MLNILACLYCSKLKVIVDYGVSNVQVRNCQKLPMLDGKDKLSTDRALEILPKATIEKEEYHADYQNCILD